MGDIIKRLITSGKDGVNNMATIIEEEGPRHILLRALQAGPGISLDVVDLDEKNFTQDRVIKISTDATFLQGPPGPPGEAGDALILVNRGNGRELFIDKIGTDLNIRTLIAGPGIVLTQHAETIQIETTPTTVSLLPVSQGGTGLSTINNNSVLVGKNNQFEEKTATSKYQTLVHNGTDVNWMNLYIPIVFSINFNASQQIESVTCTNLNITPTIISQTSFSFTNPYPDTLPYVVNNMGLSNTTNKWVPRSLTTTFRYEYDASTPSLITVIGCTSGVMGASAPGIGRMTFIFGPTW